ncbi:glycosyltransferase family protein [Phenylobacterium soli]|uniref:Glycosyltransferase n=1 Tax=Phenylobacterium soli TaxID=2170551 RepID=A0A328AM86_9CAUL|nr:glycosyltransferase family 2 protein [Phenylobacterium soli]RAK55657.1 hypothetical protein DJ017_14630 [Phenylobacterium soli]
MLSVIVEAQNEGERLPGVLAVLTSAAVEGLVREATIAGGGPEELLQVLREETGAELAQDLAEAIGAARSDLLLIMGADFRPRLGWIEALALHLREGGREAIVTGEGGGFLRRAPGAVLIGRAKAAGLVHPDLHRLRRALSGGARRIG